MDRSALSSYVTQPTQPLYPQKEPPEEYPPPSVEVAASSPLNGGSLARSIAPPGTQYRPPSHWRPTLSSSPFQPQTQLTQTQNLSDDERIALDSSDEDDSRNDIKLSVFQRGGKPATAVDRIRESSAKFGGLLRKNFEYNNADSAYSRKRSADDITNAYTGSTRISKKLKRHSPHQPDEEVQDICIENIMDYQVKQKTQQIRSVLPDVSIMRCVDALQRHHSHFQDALDSLVECSETDDGAPNVYKQNSTSALIDLTCDDRSPQIALSKASTKRDVGTGKSIADKWSTAQHSARLPAHNRVSDKLRDDGEEIAESISESSKGKKSQSTPLSAKKANDEKPRRRRLIRTRRKSPNPPGSPEPSLSGSYSNPQSESESRNVVKRGNEESNDFGMDHQEQLAPTLDVELLYFLNSCSSEELLDLSGQSRDAIDFMISQRPFASLENAVEIQHESQASTKKGVGKKKINRVGERLVDVCSEIWRGYEAVDQLVTRCEGLKLKVLQSMSARGFKPNAEGELEVTQLQTQSSTQHDSGIGSPVSSLEDNGDSNDLKGAQPRKGMSMLTQPALMSHDRVIMKDYQVVGLNWLATLYDHGLSGILADDMGLGKTCQVIAFLAYLRESDVRGPHLVIVPGSTLENWLREFNNFCPDLRVEPYYGKQDERISLRYRLEADMENINVIVTTYDMAAKKDDIRFLRRKINPNVCVYDEGHQLKNSSSERYKSLMAIPASFRLLLTGTPLQNNLKELMSLLAFILPELFSECQDDLSAIFKHKAKLSRSGERSGLLSAPRIARARAMMTPFILRRKKYQVLKQMSRKTSRIEYCEMGESQRRLYDSIALKMNKTFTNVTDSKTKSNILMSLRQAAIHPMLLRCKYTDDILHRIAGAYVKRHHDSRADYVFEDLAVMTDFELHRFCSTKEPHHTLSKFAFQSDEAWMQSAKVMALLRLLKGFRDNGHRTLLFSQFTMVMDILELVFGLEGIDFYRLDGSTPISQRQELVDSFQNEEGTGCSLFMLSTKAGGLGLNLTAADRVVIFDAGFNPHDDVQAENRAHRVGQTKDVEVIRLVAKNTIEEQILSLTRSKLALDERVAGEESVEGANYEDRGRQLVEHMMMDELDLERREKPSGFVLGGSKMKDITHDTKHPAAKRDVSELFRTGLEAGGLDMSTALKNAEAKDARVADG